MDNINESESLSCMDKYYKYDNLSDSDSNYLEEACKELMGMMAYNSKININCFTNNPSINSSLKFLRKTQWARDKVEKLYLNAHKK